MKHLRESSGTTSVVLRVVQHQPHVVHVKLVDAEECMWLFMRFTSESIPLSLTTRCKYA